jgi:acetoin utilization protein AcuB
MILRNWMEKDPVTTTSDTLVSEAIQVLVDNNLRALPVVDGEALRGLVTRKELQGCATSVARAQDKYETEYFLDRLRIKDIMIRMPKTVDASDTVEHAVLRGQQELIRNYPVMENGKLVGMVSSYELFEALSNILGAEEVWCGITLEPMPIERGTIAKVSSVIGEAGGTIFSVFTMRLPGSAKKRIIVRLETSDLDKIETALKQSGYGVAEIMKQVQACAAENGGAH